MLKVRGVSKEFPGASRGGSRLQAVQDVSFDVEEGEFFTLLGPSGCGKTTLLRSVAGLEQPDSGEIWIDDTLMFDAQRRVRTEPHRRPIGMVFQSYAIWPHMTVFDNVAFPLVQGRERMPAGRARPLVQQMLKLVSLEEFADSWATRLSGGQQQRLALARALVDRPRVLLLDEPLSNLDARLRKTLRRELKEAQRSLGVTTLYVTHDQSEALALSDRVAVLRAGQVMQVGTPREVYECPADAFVARFVGDANVFGARVLEAGRSPVVDSAFGTVRCHGEVTGRVGEQVWCFVRPENVRMRPANGASEGSEIRGRATSVDYVGDRQECTLRRGESELRGWAPPQMTVRVGDEVCVDLQEAGARVLPEGEVLDEARSGPLPTDAVDLGAQSGQE